MKVLFWSWPLLNDKFKEPRSCLWPPTALPQSGVTSPRFKFVASFWQVHHVLKIPGSGATRCLSHRIFTAGCWWWVLTPLPPTPHSTVTALPTPPPPHHHGQARGQRDAGESRASLAGDGGGWGNRAGPPPAHVRLHLRHLQNYLPAGMVEGGRGRVDRSVPGARSQGRPERRCVTLRAAFHRGHVTMSHPPQCHQTWLLSQPQGTFALCLPIATTATPGCCVMSGFTLPRDAGGQDRDPRGSVGCCGWQQRATVFTP